MSDLPDPELPEIPDELWDELKELERLRQAGERQHDHDRPAVGDDILAMIAGGADTERAFDVIKANAEERLDEGPVLAYIRWLKWPRVERRRATHPD